MFNKNTSQLLDRLFFNLPAVVFVTTILIRLLVAVPVALVSVEKFSFFGNIWVQYSLGILSVIFLEILLTVLSIINANFRKNEEDDATAFVLIFVILITGYNAYMLHSVNQFYEIKYEFSALLTLHLLNVVSVVLIESIAYIQAKSTIEPTPVVIPTPTETAPVIVPTAPVVIPTETPINEIMDLTIKPNKPPKKTDLSQNIINLHIQGKQGKEIAEMLNTNTSKVCRVLKEFKTNNN